MIARWTPTSTPFPAVEVSLIEGMPDALEGSFGSWCGERPLPLDEGVPEPVVIGGLTYPLDVAQG